MSTTLVIGVGNALRGDDAAGLEVARRLADRGLPAGVELATHEGDGLGLLELWNGAEAVVLVDSVRSGDLPGTLHRIDASSHPVPLPLGGASTHALGVAEAIELARVMGTMPPKLIVYGVEGSRYETGAALSPTVAAAVALAATEVYRETLALAAAGSPA
jgi:hydrogenase maturation protease